MQLRNPTIADGNRGHRALRGSRPLQATRRPREGLILLLSIVVLMWAVEAVNTLDSNRLDADGIYARNVDRFWGVLTSPFIHASFQHLIGNTIPFVFLGVIIALRGARQLVIVTAFVILIGGLGTWLISPSGSGGHPVDTIGCSGVVFGYAGYLLARGFFDRSLVELLIGALVAVIWGAVLVSSLVPHTGISWQAHLCGGIAGVIAAWCLSRRRAEAPVAPDSGSVSSLR
jgi:membrane associated rhomboid family serine protease